MFEERKEEQIETSSRLRALYLEKVKGHRVNVTKKCPRYGLLGQVTYSKSWVFDAADQG